MFVIKDHICLAGAQHNEDAVGWGRHYLFALDGASGLTGENLMDGGSDAAWFAQGVRDGLCRALDGGDCRSTGEILREILQGLAEEYAARARTLGRTPPKDSPSAGIALFREWPDGRVELFALGDCVAAARTAQGHLFWSCDKALPALDGKVVAQMEAMHREKGISVLEAREACGELLLRNRMLRNTPGGYWILDPSGVGVDHARVQVWAPGELESISAFSDGFAQLSAPFGLYADYGQIHEALVRTPLGQMLERLYEAQEADPEGNRFPRFKFRDDASALWAQICP